MLTPASHQHDPPHHGSPRQPHQAPRTTPHQRPESQHVCAATTQAGARKTVNIKDQIHTSSNSGQQGGKKQPPKSGRKPSSCILRSGVLSTPFLLRGEGRANKQRPPRGSPGKKQMPQTAAVQAKDTTGNTSKPLQERRGSALLTKANQPHGGTDPAPSPHAAAAPASPNVSPGAEKGKRFNREPGRPSHLPQSLRRARISAVTENFSSGFHPFLLLPCRGLFSPITQDSSLLLQGCWKFTSL